MKKARKGGEGREWGKVRESHGNGEIKRKRKSREGKQRKGKEKGRENRKEQME